MNSRSLDTVEISLLVVVAGAVAVWAPAGTGRLAAETVTAVHVAVLLLAATLFALDMRAHRLLLPDRTLLWVCGVVLAVYLAGSVRAPCRSAALVRLREVLAFLLLMLLAQRVVRHGPRHRARIIRLLIVGACLQAMLAVAASLGFGAMHGPFIIPNPNHLAVFLAAGAAMALCGVLASGGSKGAAIVYGLAAALTAWGVVATASRSGMLALTAAALLPLARRKRVWLVAVALFLAAVVLLPTPFSARLKTLGADAYTWERITIWGGALEMIADHPVLGVGVGQYRFFSPRYARPLESGRAAARYGKTARHAHNELLHTAAETGLVGLVSALALIGIVGRRALHLFRSRDPLGMAPLAGLVPLAVGALLSPLLHQPAILYGTALLCGLALGPPTAIGLRETRRSDAVSTLLALVAGAGVALLVLGMEILPYASGRELARAQDDARSGDLNRALARARRSARLFPYDPDPKTFAGELMNSHLGNPPDLAAYHDVKALLEEALRLSPDSSRILRDLAELERKYFEDFLPAAELFALGDRWYARAMALEPSNGILACRRATFDLVAGRTKAGRRLLERAIELEPNFIGARVFLVRLLRRQGSTAEALQEEADLAAVRARMRGYTPMSDFERELLKEP